jgi:hypothetical protein
VTRLCDKCDDCDGCCKCRIHEVNRLVKIPCDKEVPVRKCSVEWVCPQCHCHGNGAQGAAPSAPTPSLAPMPPPPPAPGKSAGNLSPDDSAGATILSGLHS